MVKTATKAAAPAKKAGRVAKAAAVEVEETESDGRKGLDIDPRLAKKVAKARDEGVAWADIVEEHEISTGKAMLLNMFARVEEEDRITGTPAQVAKKVVKERNNGYSWGALMARTGIGEGRLRKMFEEETGESTKGNRIGKGGRYPAGMEPSSNGTAKAAAPAKKAAKATKGVAKAGKGDGAETAPSTTASGDPKKPLVDYSLGELQARLDGKTIKVRRENDRVEAIKVKKITKKTKDGEITLSDSDSKQRTILAVHIISATK